MGPRGGSGQDWRPPTRVRIARQRLKPARAATAAKKKTHQRAGAKPASALRLATIEPQSTAVLARLPPAA